MRDGQRQRWMRWGEAEIGEARGVQASFLARRGARHVGVSRLGGKSWRPCDSRVDGTLWRNFMWRELSSKRQSKLTWPTSTLVSSVNSPPKPRNGAQVRLPVDAFADSLGSSRSPRRPPLPSVPRSLRARTSSASPTSSPRELRRMRGDGDFSARGNAESEQDASDDAQLGPHRLP